MSEAIIMWKVFQQFCHFLLLDILNGFKLGKNKSCMEQDLVTGVCVCEQVQNLFFG
jgi:hypothetical protein